MPQSPKKFAQLLTQALNRIKQLTSDPIYKIEDELGEAIHHTRETIEKWRRGRLPADLEQAEIIAKILLDKGGLIDREEFEEFLSYAGHPRSPTMWREVHSSKVSSPGPNELFVGREEKVNELLAAILDQEIRVISLCGPGGVGKTALITTVIEQLAPNNKLPKQFPDGILYYNFYGHPSVNGAFSYIIEFFDAEGILDSEESFDEKIPQNTKLRNAARKTLHDKQALLVLDGAEEADNLGELLEIRDRNKVLIGTRYRHTTRGRTVIALNPPLPDEALSILKAWSTAAPNGSDYQVWSDNPEDDQACGIEICELTGCLTLALRLAGRYMAQCHKTPTEYLEILRQTPLTVLHEQDRQHESVSILLKNNIEALPEETHSVLAVIGLLSYDPFDPLLMESVLAKSTYQVSVMLGELVRFSLIKRLSNGEYQVVHRLIHSYCREYVTVQDEILKNLVQTYLWVYGEINPREPTLKTHKGHIINILNSCVERKRWDEVVSLVFVFINWFPPHRDKAHDVDENIATLKVGIKAAQIINEQLSEADFLRKLGTIFLWYAEAQQAIHYFSRALIVYREFSDSFGELECLESMMNTYFELNEWQNVIKYADLVLQKNREFGYPHIEWSALSHLGTAYSRLGQVEQAINAYYQEAITAYKLNNGNADTDDQVSIKSDGKLVIPITFNRSLPRLTSELKKLHNYEQVVQYYEQFIEAARKTDDPNLEIAFLYELINHLRARNISDEHSNEHEDKIITACKRIIELDLNEDWPYHYLAVTYASSDKLDEASWYYQQRIKVAPDRCVDTHVFLGLMAYNKGNKDESRTHFETAKVKLERYRKLPAKNQGLPKGLVAGCEFYILLGTGQDEVAIAKLQSILDTFTPIESLFPPFYRLLITAPDPAPVIYRIDQLVSAKLKETLEYSSLPGSTND